MNGYLTVTEYAKMNGKDPGNIRKLLLSGRLSGEKVGSQWLIKADAKYPEDARVRSGKYLDYRKRLFFYASNKGLSEGLKKLTASLCDIYGSCIEAVILYGSYARGTQSAESDVDLALILKKGHTEEMHNRLVDAVVDAELANDVVISTISIDKDDYNKRHNISPLYKNISKEGIILWKAA